VSVWYRPICDHVLTKIILWLAKYEQGEVAATRKWVNLDGVLVDRPTMFGHSIAWKGIEFQHLIRVIEAVEPKAAILPDLRKIQSNLKKGRLLPGGQYLVRIAFYKEDIENIYNILMKAKTGVHTITEVAEKQKTQGKDLFEL
jgi:hypothetical protein